MPQTAAPPGMSSAVLQDRPQRPKMGPFFIPRQREIPVALAQAVCSASNPWGHAGCVWRLGGMWVSELSCVSMSGVLNCTKNCDIY